MSQLLVVFSLIKRMLEAILVLALCGGFVVAVSAWFAGFDVLVGAAFGALLGGMGGILFGASRVKGAQAMSTGELSRMALLWLDAQVSPAEKARRMEILRKDGLMGCVAAMRAQAAESAVRQGRVKSRVKSRAQAGSGDDGFAMQWSSRVAGFTSMGLAAPYGVDGLGEIVGMPGTVGSLGGFNSATDSFSSEDGYMSPI